MNEELLDDNFYEKKRISPDEWWSSMRIRYNETCLKAGFLISIIDLVFQYFFMRYDANASGSIYVFIAVIYIFFLLYFVAGNILFTFMSALEVIITKNRSVYYDETTRMRWFNILTYGTIAIPVLISLFFIILSVYIKVAVD